MKKNKWSRRRHRVITGILRPLFKLYFRIKYNYRGGKIKTPKQGSIILSNHVTALDPFLVGSKFNRNLYYMATKDLFQKRFIGKLITFLVKPIPKEKSNKGDLAAIRYCMQVAKENGNICIFPEGNRTFSGKLGNIDFSIVKLIKMLKKSLIICNIIGGYPSDPRWAGNGRKGKLDVIIKKQLSYEEYKDIDNDELYKLILSNLTVNDYELGIPFKGKNKAEHLEKILYMCPICGKQHQISSKGDNIHCNCCDTVINYQEDLTLTSDNHKFNFKYISEWYDYQVNELKKKEFNDSELIYEDDIEIYEPIMYKSRLVIGKGKMQLFNDCFKFILENQELILSYDDIYAVTLLGRKKMNIYYKDKVYQVYKDKKTNLLKYMHTYYIIKNKKEGVLDGFIGI